MTAEDAARHSALFLMISSCGLSGVLQVVCGLLLASCTAALIKQLYLHPLAKYPGPLLGRITQCYDLYHAYIGDKHINFHHLHQKYGPVVRFTPNGLSVNDPVALEAIHSHKANVQKGLFYKCFRAAPGAASTLLATDKDEHARKRRVLGQAFSDHALRGMEQYVLQHVQELIDNIGVVLNHATTEKMQWSLPVDMCAWCNWLIFDIMGDLVFGRSFGTQGTKPENRRGIHLLGRAGRRNYTIAAMPTLLHTGLERILPLLRGLYLDRRQYLAFGKAQVNERTKESAGSKDSRTVRQDIFSLLLHAKDPENEEGFPIRELWMEGNTLIVAGSDTTSTTMGAVLHYLLHNTLCLRQLEAEIRSTFRTAAEVRMGVKMQSCTYLRACIDETMRMTPAVGGLLPREVLMGGLEFPSLGLELTAGVNVGVPIYALQHHSDYVVSPFTFDPSRWLPTRTGQVPHFQDKGDLRAAFHPFSTGNRGCLGQPLVYMELSIAIARLVWEYDMRLADDQRVSASIAKDVQRGRRQPGEYHLLDWFISKNQGPWVEFRKREV